jgi:VCBS repeat-containing protein
MAVETTPVVRGELEVWKVTGLAASGDASDPIPFPKHCDVSIQAVGTFAGSISIAVQGSNEYDVEHASRTYQALRDSNESVIAITAADLVQLLESPVFIRIAATAGTGGADVTVYVKGARRRS